LIYILQARPETVKRQSKGTAELRYQLKGKGAVLAESRAIGQKNWHWPCPFGTQHFRDGPSASRRCVSD